MARDVEARERAHHVQPAVGIQRAKNFVAAGRELVFSREKKRNEDAAEIRLLLLRERRECGRSLGERWRQRSGVVKRLFKRRFEESPCVPLVFQLFRFFCNKGKH